ncbi:FecR family protein [Parabacteroides sp. Marseille-P3160]|uniref:FecR family protein n=1 Tax=Parabacteroides sp. Marseille-P3160 TaxID=1917887 RepID=UPI0009BC6D48|nr:FecR family protein [Parabacteroides sp. Marseille-P3160]
MKQKKQINMDKEHKKLLHSLNWVTGVLKRYFDGKLKEREKEIVEEQLKVIDRRAERENSLTEKQLNESDERIRKQILLRLGLEDPEKETERRTSVPPKPIWATTVSSFRKYAAVAALLVAVIVTSYFIFNKLPFLKSEGTELLQAKTILLQTGETEMKKVILPDGTTIYLNNNTRLSYYSDEFNKKEREVTLEEGEAFFEVAKNDKKPFIVHSGDIATTVRGTSFNIKAYSMLEDIVISVRTGIVDVTAEEKMLEQLTVNRQIIINKSTEQFTSGKIDWQNAVGWMDNRLVLYDAGINELKLRLQQQFDIQIQIAQDVLEDVRFTASFRADASLEDVMEILNTLYGINYRIKDNTLIINE